MISDFSGSEVVCSTEPYVHFLDGNGRLNVGLLVEKVTPGTFHYYEHGRDIRLMEKVIAYERASPVEKLKLLKVSTF